MFSKFAIILVAALIGVVYSQRECESDEFQCPGSGKYCIPSTWICDGDDDCGDMADEQNCPSTVSTPCSGFTCNTGECLPSFWQCDSEPDCDDGEDEAGCPCTGFECPNGVCIPNSWTCDGDNDCGDFSDETEQVCPCSEEEERCPVVEEGIAGQCILSEYVCDQDNIEDCPDGSDQANCTSSDESIGNPDYSTPVTQGPPGVDQRRPESVRASNMHRLSKQEEKQAIEQRRAEKRQSQFYKHRSAKKEDRKKKRA